MRRSADGFSVIELTVALALTLIVAGTVAAIVGPARSVFDSQPEAIDVQQRLRVGVEALTRDLIGAGAGSPVGGRSGPLAEVVPPVLPFRRGAGRSDPPDTFRSDAITIISVPATAVQTTLAADFDVGATALTVMPTVGCGEGVTLCGVVPGMTVLVSEIGGAFDLFDVTAVDDAASQLTVTPASGASAYPTGVPVVEARVRTYYLKNDSVTHTAQLMRSDSAATGDAPVLDHVAALTFDYLSASGTPIAASELADGPWLPNAAAASRWDADLLRIRAIGVTLRIEAALAAFRGPAGALFRHGGVAPSARLWVPDQEMRFVVSPRNLGASR